jgi:hypothetical protein
MQTGRLHVCVCGGRPGGGAEGVGVMAAIEVSMVNLIALHELHGMFAQLEQTEQTQGSCTYAEHAGDLADC